MKILIIGATSYIGSRLALDLRERYEMVGTYHSNASVSPHFLPVDIRNPEAVDRLFVQVQPDVVVHLANYSSSRKIKENIVDFPKLNLDATKIIVEASERHRKPLLFFSSMAALSQQDLYGELKAQSEEMVKSMKSGFSIIRPSAVIGLSPVQTHNKFTDKVLSVIRGGFQEFDNSWVLQPTYIGHLSQVVDQIIAKNMWNEEFNVFTDFPVTQYQIAKDILAHFGLNASPLDTGRVVPLQPVDKKSAQVFHLAPHDYTGIIEQIVRELKNPEGLYL